MLVIECLGCGRRLALPDAFPEGGEFACGYCHLAMRNVPAAREFRWAQLDPFVQKHGASRANVIGGAIGSILWLPIFAGVLIATNSFDPIFFAAVAVPMLLLVSGLIWTRGRTPAPIWLARVWLGLGIYVLYLELVLNSWLGWREILAQSGSTGSDASLLGFGAVAVVVGALSESWYRWRTAGLPHFRAVDDGAPNGPPDPPQRS